MANDTWRTPPEVYRYLDKMFDFKADVCASKDNALHKVYIDEQTNYLETDMTGYASAHDMVFCNPPYSKPLPFVRKAIKDAEEHGIGCVMLLNHDPSTRWYYELDISAHVQIMSITGYLHAELFDDGRDGKWVYNNGRLSFLGEDGTPVKGDNKPQMIAIVYPRPLPSQVRKYKSIEKCKLMGSTESVIIIEHKTKKKTNKKTNKKRKQTNGST